MDFKWTLVIFVLYITLDNVKGKPSLSDNVKCDDDDDDYDYENIFGINLKPLLDILFPGLFDYSEEEMEPTKVNTSTSTTSLSPAGVTTTISSTTQKPETTTPMPPKNVEIVTTTISTNQAEPVTIV